MLQEILHRYTRSIAGLIQPAFDALLNVVDEVFAIERSVIERAKRSSSVISGYPRATPCIWR